MNLLAFSTIATKQRSTSKGHKFNSEIGNMRMKYFETILVKKISKLVKDKFHDQ
jgi:hypothetical protein